LIVVEGRHDVEFLKRISAILHVERPELPDLSALERQGTVIFIPAGGNDFRSWTSRLAPLGFAEFYLLDREDFPESERREQWAAQANLRPRCRACVTRRRSLENYLHPDAISAARGLKVVFTASDDVAEIVAQSVRIPTEDSPAWAGLSRRARRRQRDRVKTWLNTEAVDRMTLQRLSESDPDGEIISWLALIGALLES
jgi:putative ATP-dependent endonuclease of OLD family